MMEANCYKLDMRVMMEANCYKLKVNEDAGGV